MPALTAEEYAALRDDVAANGMSYPVLVDDRRRVVDGHHRKRVADELGITDYPVEIIVGRTDEQLRDLAYRLNLHRRHLTREQVREALAASLTADPGLSDRQHAARVGASPTTAGSVRRDLQAIGDVSNLDTRTDTAGRQQPATKPVAQIEDYITDAQEAADCLAMADASDEAFEAALAAGEAEGDQSRENVVAKLRDGRSSAPVNVAGPTRRRPLPDQVRSAGYDLDKSVQRLNRLAADDRFDRNRETMAGHLRGYVSSAIKDLQDILDRLGGWSA